MNWNLFLLRVASHVLWFGMFFSALILIAIFAIKHGLVATTEVPIDLTALFDFGCPSGLNDCGFTVELSTEGIRARVLAAISFVGCAIFFFWSQRLERLERNSHSRP